MTLPRTLAAFSPLAPVTTASNKTRSDLPQTKNPDQARVFAGEEETSLTLPHLTLPYFS